MTIPLPQSPKALGSYYTPADLARRLAHFATVPGVGRILEPSAGDGSLIEACLQRGDEIGVTRASLAVTAIDVDPAAYKELHRKFGDAHRVIEGDFLDGSIHTLGKFDCIVSNPPFTRNHSINVLARQSLRRRHGINGAAGLWAYFLIASLSHLEIDGRLAMIVPSSALFTDYGRRALQRAALYFQSFEVEKLLKVPKWHNKADEKGSIIFASGYAPPNNGNRATGIVNLDYTIYSEASASLVEAARDMPTIADVCSLSIGAVTGCNPVFLMSGEEARDLCIPETDLFPMATRARHVPGITISRKQLSPQNILRAKTLLRASA